MLREPAIATALRESETYLGRKEKKSAWRQTEGLDDAGIAKAWARRGATRRAASREMMVKCHREQQPRVLTQSM